MNKGLNIFLVVLLCVVVYIGLLLSFYSSKNVEASNPYLGDVKSTRGTYGTYAVSVGANSMGSDMATISVRSANSIFHHRPVFSYAPAASMPTYSQSPIGGTLSKSVASPIYTTSSAEFHSFGGGGNTGGVSMSGGSVQSSASSVAPAALSVSMPSTSLYAYSNKCTSSSFGNMLSVSNESAVATVASYAGIGKTTSGGPMGVSGRKNATGMGGLLDDWVSGYIDDETNGYMGYDGYIYYFDYDVLYQLYLEAIANGQLPSGMTWSAFCDWMKNGNHSYAFPISSGTWFMSILALGYALIIYFKKRKLQKQL